MIEVQQLTKRYGPFTAVDGVSFNVGKGQILGFLGPNGAGKTTTMRIRTGYMPPTEGRATVAGFDLQEQPVEAKRRIGYLPETPPLYPDMTVREYLRFVARIKGVPAREQADRVSQVMTRTHVADMANRHCGKLSKGYKQRVGLAQALIHNPDVLVLDEPTAGLDPKQIIETRDLIRSLGGDHTIVLSTHILPEVAQTCQRVVIINKGRVVAEDSPENLTARLQGAASVYIEVDAQGADATPVLSAIPGVTAVSVSAHHGPTTGFEVQSERDIDIRRQVAAAVVGAGYGLVELRPMRMSLEEIFLQLTTSDVPAEAAPTQEVAGE
ncbi:MAG TPA: ABC transporter ATP-binding protein [Luteitalea sp.]|nr:ABC transporter ATP-binding protein [Luteitalea sp.]